jgi:predicted protein tyrosine phosphatase
MTSSPENRRRKSLIAVHDAAVAHRDAVKELADFAKKLDRKLVFGIGLGLDRSTGKTLMLAVVSTYNALSDKRADLRKIDPTALTGDGRMARGF